MKRTFEITLKRTITVEADESPTPDDEWRATFDDFHTLEEVAGRIAYNVAVWGGSPFVEGVGEEGDETFTIVNAGDFEIDETVEV